MGSWRKAYGALKDSTKVGLAKVNSEFKELDIAIVKATNHVECPPKERHVRKILLATSANRPRADLSYCIYALSRRLSKTKNWIVALKTLIVVHRLLREGDPMFKEEFLAYSSRGNILHIANFKDDSSQSGEFLVLPSCWLGVSVISVALPNDEPIHPSLTCQLGIAPHGFAPMDASWRNGSSASGFSDTTSKPSVSSDIPRLPARYIVKPGPCLARNSWSSCLHCSSCFSGLSASSLKALPAQITLFSTH